jgi:hypothetical protein
MGINFALRRGVGGAEGRHTAGARKAMRHEPDGRQRWPLKRNFELRGNFTKWRALLHGENPRERARSRSPRIAADGDEGAVSNEG